ncbi:MAG: hypothetical protein R3C32_06630 [Chloroflexota bacterium]
MREGATMRWGSRVVMIVACLAVVFPLLWVVRTALKTDAEFISQPAAIGGAITLDNFAAAWNAVDLGGAVMDSLVITIPGAALATSWGCSRPCPRCLGARAGPTAAAGDGGRRPHHPHRGAGHPGVRPGALAPGHVRRVVRGQHLGPVARLWRCSSRAWSTLFFLSWFRDLPAICSRRSA